MNAIGISEDIKQKIYEMISAILHLCNIRFVEDSFHHAQISEDPVSYDALSLAAKLFRIEPSELSFGLRHRTIKTNADTSSIPYINMKTYFQALLSISQISLPEYHWIDVLQCEVGTRWLKQFMIIYFNF